MRVEKEAVGERPPVVLLMTVVSQARKLHEHQRNSVLCCHKKKSSLGKFLPILLKNFAPNISWLIDSLKYVRYKCKT